jgi:hypothetical protein
VKALVVGALAEHSADVHTLVDGLAEEAIPRTSHHYLVDPSNHGTWEKLQKNPFGAQKASTDQHHLKGR